MIRSRWFAMAVLASSLVVSACVPVTPAAPTPSPVCPPGSPDGQKEWTEVPPMFIDLNKVYLATLKVPTGDIKIQLFADKAPITVNNFVFLACQGYYDNTTFHRVLQDFMAQGGDPTGTGSGGPGYQFQDEIHPDLQFDQEGLLAMANAGPGTNGSQFFITYAATDWLNGNHTIFGKVVEGMDIAKSLTLRDPQQNPTTPGDTLTSVTVEVLAASLLPPPTATPVPVTPDAQAANRPLGALEIAARENLYTGRPAMAIDVNKSYIATIETTQGNITVELFPQDAPESVNNFVVLAKLGYWDNFPINYVQQSSDPATGALGPSEFLVTGSPQSDPNSDIGYTVPNEFKRPNVAGAFGFWYMQAQAASSGSQIYILMADSEGFDPYFTSFGQVTAGLEVAAKLTAADPTLGTQGDSIVKITITEK